MCIRDRPHTDYDIYINKFDSITEKLTLDYGEPKKEKGKGRLYGYCSSEGEALSIGEVKMCIRDSYRNGVPVGMQEHGFAEAFRLAGYQTGYIGKWHLADHKESGDLLGEYNPLGFEDWKDKVEFGHCKSVIRTQDGIRPERCVGDERTYTTDWLADEAVSFMEQRQKEKPFLLMVSIPDPHQPHEVRAPYDTMFEMCIRDSP